MAFLEIERRDNFLFLQVKKKIAKMVNKRKEPLNNCKSKTIATFKQAKKRKYRKLWLKIGGSFAPPILTTRIVVSALPWVFNRALSDVSNK